MIPQVKDMLTVRALKAQQQEAPLVLEDEFERIKVRGHPDLSCT